MAFKGAIFDFDGVVVDTTPLHYRSWHRLVCGDHGCHFDADIYESIVNGRRSADSVPELLPHLDATGHKKALVLKQKYYYELLEQGKAKIFYSTIMLIKELQDFNIKIAVASSSRSVSYVLEKSKIIDLFDVIISGNDTKFGKPHPESFLKAAQGLRLNVGECVVFEDAKSGVQAAKAGGFICVGVDRKNQPDLFKLADIKVHDLHEVNFAKIDQLFL